MTGTVRPWRTQTLSPGTKATQHGLIVGKNYDANNTSPFKRWMLFGLHVMLLSHLAYFQCPP
jgi:hypothetical protein